ncbi:E3 ubiquitin-protein ligase TRIM8a isoform X2 [Stigmatopora argus]
MDESWRKCLEEELLCPICLNVFVEPILLPCKHNFCKACISAAWAGKDAGVRCPECNNQYEQKPSLEKNYKLANIVARFNALASENPSVGPQCVLCRQDPPLPARKVCLRCKEPCCQTHVRTHLRQPCAQPGHLLVDVEELSAWTCPVHDDYRLFHCQDEHAAVCPLCCISHCNAQGHKVYDVNTTRMHMQATLMEHQGSLEGRLQNIDEHLSKLDLDNKLIKGAVSVVKKRVREQYQRMYNMLKAKQCENIQMLEQTFRSYGRKNSQQVLQLTERRRQAEKLLSSVREFFQKANNINFMKNTKPYQLLMNNCCCGPLAKSLGQNMRWESGVSSIPLFAILKLFIEVMKRINTTSNFTVVQWQRQWVRTSGGLKFKSEKTLWSSGKNNGLKLKLDTSSNLESSPEMKTSVPPLSVGQISSQNFLSQLSKQEINLRKCMGECLNEEFVLGIIQTHSRSVGGHPRLKRQYDIAFPENPTENSFSQHPSTLLTTNRMSLLTEHNSDVFSSEALGQDAHSGPGHSLFLNSSSQRLGSQHSESVFSHGGTSRQGRKVLICPGAATAQPLYSTHQSFVPVTPQEFASRPLQHLAMSGIMEASQASRHPDYFGFYTQSSSKNLVRK